MKVIPSVPFGARGCSVLHGRTADPEGFIQLPPCRNCAAPQFASAAAVKVMGDEFGMVPREEATETRFQIAQLSKDLTEAREEVADNQRLERELVEARETIAKADEIFELIDRLAQEGYTAEKAKELLADLAKFRENLDEAEGTITAVDILLAGIADLAENGYAAKRKVLA